MGIYVFANPKCATTADLKESSASSRGTAVPRNSFKDCRHIVSIDTIDLPRYAAEDVQGRSHSLGCVRGIAFALAIQAAVALFALVLWRLF